MNRNSHFQSLRQQYLFTEIANRTEQYRLAHPDAHILRLGVGDVTLPLAKPIIQAMHQAVDELANPDTFRGYGPEDGYEWLKQTIIDHDYTPRGLHLDTSELFISDGAGSDLGNLSELFDAANIVAVQDPSYPAYVDTSIMAGRPLIYLPCTVDNGFIPAVPDKHVDIIYLCYPNNPTGVMLTYDQLSQWVDYARREKAVIIYDAAYKSFISSPHLPHSIYEVDGAEEVAIEVCSFSKMAGFTSLRCGYTVVPKQTGLQAMWLRRQCTKYNGTSYIAQRAAQAVYSPAGQQAVRQQIDHYLYTATSIRSGLQQMGYEVYGGQNAPYIWCRTPHNMDSWAFFDLLLHSCQVVCTPGIGFGPAGQGFVRFSAFSPRQACIEALERIKKL